MEHPSEPADALPPRFDPRRRRAATFALVLVTALASFESTVVSTAMPTIIGELRGLSLYSWVFSIYLLAATVTMPIYGRLADLYGRRRILLVAIALFVGGAAACAVAGSMRALIVARAIQGLGAGGLMPVALIVVADLFTLRERARVQGLFSAVWGVAALTGPMLGAALTVAFGWRSIFSINLPLGVIAFVLVAVQMVESRATSPEPLDAGGALALTGGVTALLLGVLPKAGDTGAPSGALRGVLITGGLVLIALFAWLQTWREHPLIPPALFRQARTVAPYVAGVLLGTTIFGVDTFVPLFVQGTRAGTAMAAGAVVTPVVLFWALSAGVAARAVVAFGFRRTAQAGAVLVLLGFAFLLAAALAHASVPVITATCALIGAGLGPSSMAQVLAIQHATEERVRGVATSLVPFFRAAGGALGVAALGALLAAGLSERLGPHAEAAGTLLAHGGQAATATVAPESLLRALEASLLPVFALLLALAAVNLVVASFFPTRADEPQPAAATSAMSARSAARDA